MQIKQFAREHGYRVRNLHDGFPVPPATRRRGRGAQRSRGYHADTENAHLAIVCKHGYVDANGWTILCRSSRQLGHLLKRLVSMDYVVQQEGDTEASGLIPVGLLAPVLRVLKPWRPEQA